MSGVFKSIKKVFKKVVKVVKKIAVPVLAAAAIYFTASGAMSGAGYGGWGSAVSAGAKNVAGTGLLGDVLAGAVTQAGYGAIAGGIVNGVTGGSITDGMATGALAGGIGGGISGGFGYGTSPLPSQLGTAAPAAASPAAGALAASGAAPAPTAGVPVGPANVAAATTGAVAPASTSSGGMLNGLVNYAKSAPGSKFLGNIASGVGQGFLAGQAASDNAEAIGKAAAADRAAVAANYGTNGGLLTADQIAALSARRSDRGGLTPTDKFDPVQYRGGGDTFRFDPMTGQIITV